jgi:Fe-S-cluster containining protein
VADDVYNLAGDRITLTHAPDGTSTLHFSDKGTGRVCGGCTACCKLPPIPGPPLHKPAGVRCKHARTGKGCSIYSTRPMACRVWACRWLADKETAGMPRPDRAHYVIDIQEDYIEMVPHDGGPKQRVGVIQVWVDPAYRDAYKAPELRAYMLRMAVDHRMATIVRFSSREAVTIFPPPICEDRQWHEVLDGKIVDRTALDRQVMEELERYEVGFSDGSTSRAGVRTPVKPS